MRESHRTHSSSPLFIFSLVILSALISAACSPGQTVENPSNSPMLPPAPRLQIPQPHNQVHRLEIKPSQIDRVISEAQVSCDVSGSDESCPGNVAMLLIRESEPGGDRLSQCTGFLIAPDLLMTNSHCLPKQLRNGGASCNGITAVFPPQSAAAKEPFDRVECASVVFASAIDADESIKVELDPGQKAQPRPDLAVVRLAKKPGRAPVRLKHKGFDTGHLLTAWVVDPVSEKIPGGTLRKKVCHPVTNTILAPDFIGLGIGPSDTRNDLRSSSAIASFTDCEILRGNSGGPAFEEDGTVSAIVFATLPARSTEGIAIRPKLFQAMSLMTSLACVDLKMESKTASKTDEQPPILLKSECLQPTTKSLQLNEPTARYIREQTALWRKPPGKSRGLSGLRRFFDYETRSAHSGAYDLIWSEPKCYRAELETLLSRRKARSSSESGQNAPTATHLTGLPVWKARFDINERYQPRVTLLTEGKLVLSITIEPQAEPGELPVTFGYSFESDDFTRTVAGHDGSGSLPLVPKNLTLPRCPPAGSSEFAL